jgi:tetratricopeptide (TPR) repeat protein
MGVIPHNNPLENRRLDSWKDIAAFFGRDKSTVRRWETERGLPVHRLPGMGRGSVYAFTDELQEWLRKPEAQQEGLAEPGQASAAPASEPRIRWLTWVAAGALALAGIAVAYSYRTLHFGARAAVQARSRHVPTPEAQDFYLKGQFYWNQRTPESLNRAVDSFTQAVVRDPAYAQAYVGLAESYNLLREFSVMPATEAYPRALAAEKKAVELDDASAEAHTDLAFTTLYWKWDWPTAEQEFKRAIALDPNNAHAHHWYATALLAMHRRPDALVQIDRAQKLDPSSMAILADKGFILYYADQQEAGIALLRQMETAEPAFVAPHRYLAEIFAIAGNYTDSFAERKKMDLLLHDQADLAVTNAAEQGLATGGVKGMLQSTLSAQEKLYPQGRVSPFALAQTCAQLGRNDDAIRYLREAYDRRELRFLVDLKDDHSFDRLRSQTEFQELQAKLNAPRPD